MDKETYYIRIERKVVIGMILNDDFLEVARPLISRKYLLGGEDARLLVSWVYDYHSKTGKAPKERIQQIYSRQLSNGKIDSDTGDNIEGILENLSEEAEKMGETEMEDLFGDLEDYANYCKAVSVIREADDLLETGDIVEVKELLTEFEPVEIIKVTAAPTLQSDEDLDRAFAQSQEPLIKYPGAVGRMLNPHMLRESFFIFLAQNKGGKSFQLMEAAFRGAAQNKNVLFYQGGDMTTDQLARRQAIYACERSDRPEYCGPLYIPVVDCQKNLRDECYEDCRIEPDQEGPLSERGTNWFENEINFYDMRDAYENEPNHVPCTECLKNGQYHKFKGALWYEKKSAVDPLTKSIYKRIRKNHQGKFKTPFRGIDKIRVSSHSSDSLSMSMIRAEVIQLIKEGWPPEIVIVDYMDLLSPDWDTIRMIPRDQENAKYKRGRKLTQDFNLLLLSASQSDADGFMKRLLDKRNFSEDRRKLDHITGMAGLNMSLLEKKLGLMRMNEIVSRETEGTKIVNVLHRLQIGRPILGSY